MPEDVILGRGREFKKISRDSWENEVVARAAHVPAILDFMTPEHHLVRNLVVEEIARTEKPVAPEAISAKLGMAMPKIDAILDDLQKNLFFLVRDSQGLIIWAFPVTAERTPHRLTFDTGERPYAA